MVTSPNCSARLIDRGQLDGEVSAEDKENFSQALRTFGFLDKDHRYWKSEVASSGRGYDQDPGGGITASPVLSEPLALGELVQSDLWRSFRPAFAYDLTPALFQPVGGMDRIPMAIHRQVAPFVQFGAKVVRIDQDDHGVQVAYVDARRGGPPRTARADWCVCTIPLSILSQIEMSRSASR